MVKETQYFSIFHTICWKFRNEKNLRSTFQKPFSLLFMSNEIHLNAEEFFIRIFKTGFSWNRFKTENFVIFLFFASGVSSYELIRHMLASFILFNLMYLLNCVTRLGDLLDFGQFFKALATINLPKSPTFLGNACKDVKIFNFSSDFIFGQLL